MKKLIVTFFCVVICVVIGCANINAMNFSQTESKRATTLSQKADQILRLIHGRNQFMVITARTLKEAGNGATKVKIGAVKSAENLFSTINTKLSLCKGETLGNQFCSAVTQLLQDYNQKILQAQCKSGEDALSTVINTTGALYVQAQNTVEAYKAKFSYNASNAQVNGMIMNKQLANDLGWRDGSGPGPEAAKADC